MYDKSSLRLGAARTQRGRAFTLIEVLVVVAIIALLIAILLPSLGVARWQAKNVACKGNLHDLGIAFQTYANTQRGFFPMTTWGGQDSYMALWQARLLPNYRVLICPATHNVVRAETLVRPVAVVTLGDGTRVPIHQPPSDIECVAGDDFDRCKQPGPGGPDDASGGHSYEYQGKYEDRDGEERHKSVNNFKLPPYQTMLVIDADNGFRNSGKGCQGSVYGASNGNNCPQSWDNHGAGGMNAMYGDSHAAWEKKFAGIRKHNENGPLSNSSWVQDENFSLDMIWLKSEYPYAFK